MDRDVVAMIRVKSIKKSVVSVALFASISLPISSFADNVVFQDGSYQSYVQFIEEKVVQYESTDGFRPGSYGEKDGVLTITEVCNVGGQLVHDVPGFAQWTYTLYRQGELSPMGYSIVIGGATISLFEYQEAIRNAKVDQTQTLEPEDTDEISFSNTNIENLLGHYQ